MTIQGLLSAAEQALREDNEYWDQMGKLRGDIDQLIHKHNKIMAATIIRLAAAMVIEQSNSSCTDCNGVYVEGECPADD